MPTLDEQIALLADHAEQAALAGEHVVVPARRMPARRRRVAIAAAGLAAAGIVAIAFAPRWIEPEPPLASLPPTPSSTTPTTEPAPFPESTLPRPTRFPALPAMDDRDARVTGTYSGRSFGTIESPPTASAVALVSRIEGDEIVAGAQIAVFAEPLAWDEQTMDSLGAVTIGGRAYDVWAERGTPVIRSLVDRDDPRIIVSGVDPDAYLEALGSPPALDVTVGGASVVFDVVPPAGWTVVIPPTTRPANWIQPQMLVTNPAGGEGLSVDVSLAPDLPGWGSVHPLRRVDINGVEGWITEDAAYIVFWPLGDGEWASAVAPTTAEDVLSLARSVVFLDELTWRERYGVDPPVFGP